MVEQRRLEVSFSASATSQQPITGFKNRPAKAPDYLRSGLSFSIVEKLFGKKNLSETDGCDDVRFGTNESMPLLLGASTRDGSDLVSESSE